MKIGESENYGSINIILHQIAVGIKQMEGAVISFTDTAKKIEYMLNRKKHIHNATPPQEMDFAIINDMLVAGTGDLS